jgi:hypothetical protein
VQAQQRGALAGFLDIEAVFPPEQIEMQVAFLVVGLLFLVGYHWAKYVDVNRWWAGLGLMSLGLILVGAAIVLGG